MKITHREKRTLAVLIGAITFYFCLLRIDRVAEFINYLIGLLSPFILGGAIAFIINVPMYHVENVLKKYEIQKGRRLIAFLVTLFLIWTFFSTVSFIVLPQLTATTQSIIVKLQALYEALPQIVENRNQNMNMLEKLLAQLNVNWEELSRKAISAAQGFLTNMLENSTGVIGSVLGGFTTTLLSMFFAIYLLMGKEKISGRLKNLCLATIGTRRSERVFHVFSLANKTFSSFISGQCLEAVILGSMFVASMFIFKMPYAVLIGVIIAITALIPIFGAFIGCGVGMLLIAFENPMQAFWFLIMFLIIQQIEGNLIYPYVVGSSVGLPSILVFMAVILGGNIMGVAGMLLFIPLTSVCYTLTKEYVSKKLNLPAAPAKAGKNPPDREQNPTEQAEN